MAARKRAGLVEAELDYERSYTDYDYSDEEFEAVDKGLLLAPKSGKGGRDGCIGGERVWVHHGGPWCARLAFGASGCFFARASAWLSPCVAVLFVSVVFMFFACFIFVACAVLAGCARHHAAQSCLSLSRSLVLFLPVRTFFPISESRERAVNFVESKYRHFVETNASKLAVIEDAISTSLSEVWSVDRVYVGLKTEPYEQATLLELASTENKVLSKILAALGSLCLETRLLRAEAATQVFAPLALHGEALTGDDAKDDGDLQIAMGRLMPLLQGMCVFVRRCYAVIVNTVHQLASLYSNAQRFFNVANIHFREVFVALGDVLAVLITIEEIIRSNAALRDGWASYRRMVATMRADPSTYETDKAELDELMRLLGEIDTTLFDDMIVDNAIRQRFDLEDHFDVTGNRAFRAEFEWALEATFGYLEARIHSASETSERRDFVGLVGCFVLFHTLYPDATTQPLTKALWAMHANLPLLHLYGSVVWFPCDWLAERLPEKAVRYGGRPTDVKAARGAYLKSLASDLPAVVHALYLQVSVWAVRLETNLAKTAPLAALIDSRTTLLLRGLVLACNIGTVFHTAMGLYTKLRRPLTPSRIRALCQLVELLKTIEQTYFRRTMLIAENVPAIVQQMSLALERMFEPAKAELEAVLQQNNSSLDALAGINLVLAMLEGPSSEQRRLVLRLALSVAMQKPILRAESFAALDSQLRRIDVLCSLMQNVRAACNCDFMYWTRVLLPTYFRDCYDHPSESFKVPYVLAALQDAAALLHRVEKFNGNVTVASFASEVSTYFEENFVKPLCNDVEVELRVQCHTELLVHKPSPYSSAKRDLAPFFRVKPLNVLGRVFTLAERVACYLDATFYNITAVSLQDWTAYAEMRTLAAKRYGLVLTDSHLQGHSQQLRLDILVIMRNIAVFVERYDYNLNAQLFIERVSSSKALNSIDIDHIAASIRTHGPGVMNTAVNFVYQFLKQRFQSFAVFLLDDHISSPLSKDDRWYAASRDELGHVYPYDRADAFNRNIRNLGTQAGVSHLDRFRVLVTQIGNAMGYVRMLRSGSLHALADEIKFVPDLSSMLALQDLTVEAGLSTHTVEAARLLDTHLRTMIKNFTDESDYFALLTAVFGAEYRSEANAFLRNFYIIVPALTINYVEHMIESKERLLKKNKDGATFTDDGFAMGLAFLLEVLDVVAPFKTLHWFESVDRRYREQEAKVNAEASKKRTKLERETANLTLNKLAVFRREFELLYFTFSGASIFFKTTR